MKIMQYLLKNEIEILQKINLNMQDKEYTEDEVKELSDYIYKNGYMNWELTYNEAELYKKILEKVRLFSKLDTNRVEKYTKEEFEMEYYFSTNLMHNVIWTNPRRINDGRKKSTKKLLSEKEYKSIKEINRINTEKFENYLKYLKQKYGEDLEAVSEYYSFYKK